MVKDSTLMQQNASLYKKGCDFQITVCVYKRLNCDSGYYNLTKISRERFCSTSPN